MKRSLFILLIVSCSFVYTRAQELKSEETQKVHAAEIRVGAEFTKHFDRPHLTLGVSEEIRSRVYETNNSAYFRRSYTTVQFGWHPIDPLKVETGYTLRLFGDKGWTAPKEFLRHRVYACVIGQLRLGQWKLSLRERLDVNMRADSVNVNEKSAVDLRLRRVYGVLGWG